MLLGGAAVAWPLAAPCAGVVIGGWSVAQAVMDNDGAFLLLDSAGPDRSTVTCFSNASSAIFAFSAASILRLVLVVIFRSAERFMRRK
jgi:hypothetical protein